jgi:TatD DNase family protein
MEQLVDIGVNLGHSSFDKDRPQVIDRALNVGVNWMVVTGTSIPESAAAIQLAKAYPHLYATAGIHPHSAKESDSETLKQLEALAVQPEVVALGECGLDFNRDFSPRSVQEDWFEQQIQLACQLKLPLFLHERDAHERFVAILKPYRSQITAAVVHCFTGNLAELTTYLDLDLHIGITGWICDERRGQNLQEIVHHIPLSRLMLETDAPYLMPRTIQPRPKHGRNEPSFLPYVLAKVAQHHQYPMTEVADQTTKTAKTFFKLT